MSNSETIRVTIQYADGTIEPRDVPCPEHGIAALHLVVDALRDLWIGAEQGTVRRYPPSGGFEVKTDKGTAWFHVPGDLPALQEVEAICSRLSWHP